MITKQQRYKYFIDYITKHQPSIDTELVYKTPYQLLVAVILSAQCTDKRVNKITAVFFKNFPDAKNLAKATNDEVFEIIKSCSYPNNKTKHLIGMAKTLVNDFNDLVPSDINELQKLPGVGRKTANVIASVVFNKPTMAVDTHVFRVAARIGLTTNAKNPLQTENQLMKNIPKDKIGAAHSWLILHGRYICKARNPKCNECGIKSFCKYYQTLSDIC